MAPERRRASKPQGRSGQKHGWLSLDEYIRIHTTALARHHFVLEDKTEFVSYKDDNGIAIIVLAGTIACQHGIIIEIEKMLDVRLNHRDEIEVTGREYRYHAHIPGQGNLLRYDNHHDLDTFDRHEYVFPTAHQRISVLTRQQMPTLIRVVDELHRIARKLGLSNLG